MLRYTGAMKYTVDRENKWLSIQEAADELGVHPRTVRRYIRLERLPVSRISNKVVRIRLADLDRLMEANVKDRKPPVHTGVQAARPASFSAAKPGKF